MKKTSVLLLAFASLCCFAGVFDAKSFVLHDGAVVENGILKLDGKKAYATIPGTEKISFAAPGVTFACAVKPAFDARKGSGEMMDSYFSRNRAPFTICRWGGLISTRIVNKKTGKYQIDFTPTETGALSPNFYVYDLRMTLENIVFTPLYGYLNIQETVFE